MNAQTVESLLYQAERLPLDERLLLIERLVESIRRMQRKPPVTLTEDDLESACGILQAPRPVNLEQMDAAIKQRGGRL